MRILVANYRYFVSGGPERYMFGMIEAMQNRGHDLVPFSIDYEQNVATPYERYFAPPLGTRREVYFKSQTRSLATFARTLTRAFYDPHVFRLAGALITDTKPDVAYILHYLRKLSPAVIAAIKARNIPVVVRLSDYMMLCPQAHFLRDDTPCTRCMHGALMPSVRHRCVQGSLGASLVNAAATLFHRWRGYFDLIDVFVVTNKFMFDMMASAGFPEKRLRLIPTCVDTRAFQPSLERVGPEYVGFAGRLEHIKGVHVLVDAIGIIQRARPDIQWRFKIAGDGDADYVGGLRAALERSGAADRVDFVGAQSGDALVQFIAGATLQVVPSITFENLPNSLLESFACGVPVIASDIGSLSDAVESGFTGYKFSAGDAAALAAALAAAWDERSGLAQLGANARGLAMTTYSVDSHMTRLESLFREVQ